MKFYNNHIIGALASVLTIPLYGMNKLFIDRAETPMSLDSPTDHATPLPWHATHAVLAFERCIQAMIYQDAQEEPEAVRMVTNLRRIASTPELSCRLDEQEFYATVTAIRPETLFEPHRRIGLFLQNMLKGARQLINLPAVPFAFYAERPLKSDRIAMDVNLVGVRRRIAKNILIPIVGRKRTARLLKKGMIIFDREIDDYDHSTALGVVLHECQHEKQHRAGLIDAACDPHRYPRGKEQEADAQAILCCACQICAEQFAKTRPEHVPDGGYLSRIEALDLARSLPENARCQFHRTLEGLE